jgi:hypothetical protein
MRRITILWLCFISFIALNIWQDIDLIQIIKGWHLVLHYTTSVVLISLFYVGFLMSKKSN